MSYLCETKQKDMTTTTFTQSQVDYSKVTDKVRNYQGTNGFVHKMKQSLSQWGRLTPKQVEAVEKCLNSEVTKLNVENLSEELKAISNYDGPSQFVNDIKSKFQTYGTLTTKQIDAGFKQIQKEKNKEETIHVRWKTPGETLMVGRKIAQSLKETYNLEFNPMLIDITRILAISPKAVKFSGKLTTKKFNICRSCAKTLTDDFSMLTGMGKICAGHLRVQYITDKSEVERFNEDYRKRVEEIGEMEFWISKSQIKKWEGKMSKVLDVV